MDGKPSIGLAGAFIGLDHNVLLVAGGANFPEKMPWEGGKKAFHNEIYILSKKKSGKASWIETGIFKLKRPIAYGASVSTTTGLVCIGGEDQQAISKQASILNWDQTKQQVVQRSLPDLPIPLTNAAAAAIGPIIYVAGGETIDGVSDRLFSFDLSGAPAKWVSLPNLPHALSHAVLIAGKDGNQDKLYLVGGRKKTITGISELYDQVYAYDPAKGQWVQRSSLPYALSAGTGLALGKHSLLLFGGDKGLVFHQTEELIAAIAREKEEDKKRMLTEQKASLQASHPGFSRDILKYDIRTDRWSIQGQINIDIPVTTQALLDGKNILIPSGEIRAGVRSPWIIKAELNKNGHE